MELFTETLDGWASWCRLFRSLTAFEPLVRGILHREGLPCDGLVTAAGPGTNAVFRAGRIGELVVKIFAPPESGIDSPKDYEIELHGLERAGRGGVPSPALCAHGVVEDRYRFAYLVMAFQPGEEAGVALRGMDGGEKRAFVRRLRSLIDRLSDPPFEKGEPVGLLRARAVKNRSVENPRSCRRLCKKNGSPGWRNGCQKPLPRKRPTSMGTSAGITCCWRRTASRF